jgi:3'(2'), 5'-bisphosphate nucleotidase
VQHHSDGDNVTTQSDAELSRTVAQEAGQLLLKLREDFFQDKSTDTIDKAVSDLLRDQADRASHVFIMEKLSEARPHDAILSEEGKDNNLRLDAERVWIVDPLDGTWEYGQNRPDFAVHIALWHSGDQKLSAGTVDLPAQGLTRSVLDDVPFASEESSDGIIRVVASRSRPPKTLKEIVSRLGEILRAENVTHHSIEIVDVGSVGAKVNEILSGRADIYLHDTGFYEWDVAAPYVVAEHYGLIASHMTGKPITFNHMPPYVTDLVVARPELYPHVLRALLEIRGA